MTKKKSDGIFLRLIQGLFLFNVADALLSIQLIGNEKILEEANPLWGDMVSSSPCIFLSTKLLIASAVCGFFYFQKHRKLAQAGIILTFSAYLMLILSFYFFIFM